MKRSPTVVEASVRFGSELLVVGVVVSRLVDSRDGGISKGAGHCGVDEVTVQEDEDHDEHHDGRDEHGDTNSQEKTGQVSTLLFDEGDGGQEVISRWTPEGGSGSVCLIFGER